MHSSRRTRWAVADAIVVALVAAVVAGLALLGAGSGSGGAGAGSGPLDAAVAAGAPGRPVPPGFLGLSIEYPAVAEYAGPDPAAPDPLFAQLVRNIAGPAPVLRIGGDSTDWTWWPVAGISRPPGVTYNLTPRWLAVARRLTNTLGARLLLGINLEADSTAVASAQANALVGALGRGAVQAFELGNEPELYGALPWYRTAAGQPVKGRSSRYDFAAYTADFGRIAAALPPLPLAGPTISGPGWMRDLGQFMAAHPRLSVLTLHHYPLQLCFVGRRSPHYPSITHLLAPSSSSGLAAGFTPAATLAHRYGRTLRVDELNTVSCGADPAVSQTFASALWSVDALFEMVRAGVDGVNIHTFPGAGYELFSFANTSGRWTAKVSPEYYGLLMFAQATPPGARLLPVSGVPGRGAVRVWATRAPDGRVRVAAINKDATHMRIVHLSLPGATGGSLEWLRAPGVGARTGITLGGFSFGTAATSGRPAPHPVPVRAAGGRFVLRLPPGSAALLTATPSG